MLHPSPLARHRAALSIVIILFAAALLPWSPAAATPAAPLAPIVVTLEATDDAGTIESVPTASVPNAYLVLNKRAGGDFDWNFLKFDLSVLPVNATITAAGLQLNVNAAGQNIDVEAGRADGAWDETSITWNTKPGVTWGGPVATVGGVGSLNWPVTALVQAWHAGTPNHGFAVRGVSGTGAGVRADSKETGTAPRLIIAYTLPVEEGPRRDFGDAPDSTNNVGIPNTAYAGVNGNFPTVHAGTPANQAAGPRHDNATGEGYLGEYLSREEEADGGQDQDNANNILNGGLDNADNDRGDDGWRNRNVQFAPCQRTTLMVRVSKAPGATLNRMYLNVWFDGNRDGDWADLAACPQSSGPSLAGYEWLVHDYIVDMTAIPAGGYIDIPITTERVFNATPGLPHWMRFTLSEERAVQPLNGDHPDGRGPHPQGARGSFQFGETEDIFQRPQAAGEAGTLLVDKQVIADGDPVEWIDYVTYEIRLRQDGGSQPMQVQMQDVLPYPLIVYPTVDANGIEYVQVESATGGAAPLQAMLEVIPPSGGTPPQQVVRWQGSLAPNAEVKFTFQVRVLALCAPNQQTMNFVNTAQARPLDGTVVADQASFNAKCIGYDENNIDFESSPITPTLDIDDLAGLPWSGTVTNRHPVSVTLGIYQRQSSSVAGSAAELDKSSPLLAQISLAPNEVRPLTESWPLKTPGSQGGSELDLPDDDAVDLGVGFCILPPGMETCPDAQQFPYLHGGIPFTLTVRPNDLGDAPDSTNHAGAGMTAYPGVPAKYPTVFDPATGLPEGPRHRFPGPLHLGLAVSREAEADLGPDQDPLLNIRPAANDPDNDRGDDGPVAATWTFNHCQQTILQTRITVAPAAVTYFQNQGTQAYLNVWIDSNRDGDWDDSFLCGQQAAPEHILIDSPVNVVAMGAGLHTIASQTGLVPWTITDKPAWVRVTLSERPANKTLQAGNVTYGDGRGYPQPFKTGETEDFYYRPAAAGGGPDLDVQMTARSQWTLVKEADLQAAAVDKLGNFEIQLFKVDYANVGATGVSGALLEFQIPEQFHGQRPNVFKSTNAASEQISFNFDRLSVALPSLQPSAGGSFLLGWYGCITCTRTSRLVDQVNGDYAASVNVVAPGDVDTSNNQSSATARSLLRAPQIGAFMDYTDDAAMDYIVFGRTATCRVSPELGGEGEPNRTVELLVDGQVVGTTQVGANGRFLLATGLEAGPHRIQARYAGASEGGAPLWLKVDPKLPFDPVSASLTDSKGIVIPLGPLGYSFGATQTGTFLRSGETYMIGVNACGSELNRTYQVVFNDVLVLLADPDGDGRYTGSFTYNPTSSATVDAAAPATPVDVRLLVTGAGAEQSFGTTVQLVGSGTVGDRTTGQPLAGALVTLYTQMSQGLLSLWNGALSGQSNPQTTDGAGVYGYVPGDGDYQLAVERTGYQPYIARTSVTGSDALVSTVLLAPEIAESAAQAIAVDAAGFSPPVLRVRPGTVLEWVNTGLEAHTATHSSWDSGLLTPGMSFKVKLETVGTYSYVDAENPLNQATIIVDPQAPGAGSQLYLPVVRR